MSGARLAAEVIDSRMGGGIGRSGREYRVRCPVHGGDDRNLSIRDNDDGTISVRCYSHDCSKSDILNRIEEFGGRRTADERPRREDRPTPPPAGTNRKLDMALTIWREGRSLYGTLAQRYLAERDIDLPAPSVDCLRFHPRLRHPTNDEVPGLVALVRHPVSNAPLGIHRTFLDDNGRKTTLKPDRALLGGGGLGVIKLVDDAEITDRLELVEGIESGLALLTAAARGGYMLPPIWAATCVDGFALLPALRGVEVLVLHPDNDLSTNPRGQRASQRLIARWSKALTGCEFFVSANPRGKDWNDHPEAA